MPRDEAEPPLALCHECDWVSVMPTLAVGDAALCPRCGHRLAERHAVGTQAELAWGLAALITLLIALGAEFVSFETSGIANAMTITDAAGALLGRDYVLLAALVLATTVILPALFLLVLLYLNAGLALGRELPASGALALVLRPVSPWIMSDVFIVGVLVSLIKIITLANIHVGPGFVAFCAYAVLMLRAIHGFDPEQLWDRIAGRPQTPAHVVPGRSGKAQQVTDCAACGALFAYRDNARCPRCGRPHLEYGLNRLQITWALLVTASLLMIPANALPILNTASFGSADKQTIVGGAWYLAQHGSLPIAVIIFLASIIIPIAKIMALGWLCTQARNRKITDRGEKMRIYRMTEIIGRWSMIDVYVVAVLTALVQAGVFMAITPGPAALYFAGVVITTMLAAMTFDTRLLWQGSGQPAPPPAQ